MKNFYTFFPKIFESNLTFVILIILYVAFFTIQINLYPFERYPGWDHLWLDTLTAGKLFSLQNALRDLELPLIDPYTGFGWNIAGDHHPFWALANLLVLVFSPQTVMMLNQMIFLALGGIGAYFFLHLITRDRLISLLGGLSYMSAPFVIGLFYFYSSSHGFYFVPFFLLLIHKILERHTTKWFLLFVGFSVFAIGSAEIHFLIVFPGVVLLYSFLTAWRYYRLSFLNAVKKSFFLTFLVVLSGSFFIVPIFSNLLEIRQVVDSLEEAKILPAKFLGFDVDFFAYFGQYGLDSLYKPIEGSGLHLYIPAFFYITIGMAFLLKWRRALFREDSRQFGVVWSLLVLGASMFLLSVVFYSPLVEKMFPGLIEGAKGVLRYHINLIPFVGILAGFVCFGALNNLQDAKRRKKTYIAIILFSLLVDLALFARPHPWIGERPFNSSNLIPLQLPDTLYVFPFLHLLFLLLLFSFNVLKGHNLKGGRRAAVHTTLVFSVILLPLLNISLHNEWLVQSVYRTVTRNSYWIDSYRERRACVDGKIGRYDPNYRTLYAGTGPGVSDGRNRKLIAETELHAANREKALFSYREFEHPYTGLLRESFTLGEKGLWRSNIMPPRSEEVASNMDMIRFMGVKWIISADEKIESADLVFHGECITEDGPIGMFSSKETGGVPTAMRAKGGSFFLYEVKNSLPIAFLVDGYKRVSVSDSLRMLYKENEYPWQRSVAYLEVDPIPLSIGERSDGEKAVGEKQESARIVRETYSSVEMKVNASRNQYLVLSSLYRPGWRAAINNVKLEVYRAYGGFMAFRIPAGEHTIRLRYFPSDVYAGFFLTFLALLFPFGMGRPFSLVAQMPRACYWGIRSFLAKAQGTALEERTWMKRTRQDVRKYIGKNLSNPHRGLLVQKIGNYVPFTSILEIGCGYGPDLYLLAKQFPEADSTGIDINRFSVQEGNEFLKREKVPNVRLLEGKADELGMFQDREFDIIFTDATLMYIGPDKIRQVIREMFRISKRALILVEMHRENPAEDTQGLGVYRSGWWERDYRALLKQFARGSQIRFTKIPPDPRQDKNWQTFGYLIEVIL